MEVKQKNIKKTSFNNCILFDFCFLYNIQFKRAKKKKKNIFIFKNHFKFFFYYIILLTILLKNNNFLYLNFFFLKKKGNTLNFLKSPNRFKTARNQLSFELNKFRLILLFKLDYSLKWLNPNFFFFLESNFVYLKNLKITFYNNNVLLKY